MPIGDLSYPVPEVVNLAIPRDADTTIPFVLLDSTRRHPLDITGDTVKLVVADGPGGTLKLTTQSNTVHTDPTNGVTSFTISKAAINAAASSTREESWVYEVRRLDGGTSPEVVHITGELWVLPTVAAT